MSYNAIHNTNFKPQDIREWDKDIDVDLIMHGSPCQDFSVAGKGAGGDEGSGTRSSLMYETIRIVNKLKPKYVIWENVKNLLSKKHKHNFDKYVDIMLEGGYNSYYQVLNAKDYGIPQNRERVFTISIRQDIDTGYTFPEKQELKLKLKDMLENNVDEKYYLSDKAIQGRLTTNYEKYKLEENIVNNKEIHPTILARFEGAPTLYINNNTKKGYLEAQEGDGIDIENINSKTRRGRVQKDMIQTLNTSDSKAVVIKDNRNLKEQLCDKLVESHTVVGGEIINHSYTNSKQRNTLDKYIESKDGIFPTMTTRPDILGVAENKNNLRIRKLTPKECWRLMGFDDSDFEKAEKVNSNSQLYKQAGNSIVVNVLEGILKNLFEGG